ncbi:MAG: hypothetical protein WCI72_06655 [archaeon]
MKAIDLVEKLKDVPYDAGINVVFEELKDLEMITQDLSRGGSTILKPYEKFAVLKISSGDDNQVVHPYGSPVGYVFRTPSVGGRRF